MRDRTFAGRMRSGGLICALAVACGGTASHTGSGTEGVAGGHTSGGVSGSSGGVNGTPGGDPNGASAGRAATAGSVGMSGAPGTGGSAGAGSGGGATGGSASAGSGGGATTGCAGAFGEPSVVFTLPGMFIESITLSPDELELFYSGFLLPDGESSFFRTTRASKVDEFTPGTSVAELDVACGDPSLRRMGDLSFDGLRFYFSCHEESGSQLLPGDLRLARRTAPGAPFEVDEMTYGHTGTHPTLNANELELFVDNYGSTTTYYRPDVSWAFDTGFTGLEYVGTPDLSHDDRFLFGARRDLATNSDIVEVERGESPYPYGEPEVVVSRPSNANVLRSPEISDDCRALYYIASVGDPVTQTITDSVNVLQR